MSKSQKPPPDAATIRRLAEDRVPVTKTDGIGPPPAWEAERLLQELGVHKIELEMQNEELQKSRAEREALLAQYTSLYDNAPVGYVTLDAQGTIRQANVTSARLLGLERSQLVSRRLGVFVAEADRRTFSDFVQQALSGAGRAHCEVRLKAPDAEAIEVRIEGTPSTDGEECLAVIMDVTEQSMLRNQVLQAQKMESVGLLAGGVAHDFNNLLTVIIGGAELAMGGLPASDPLRADLEAISDAGERAAVLTRQLLAFSRKQVLRPEVLSLTTAVESMLSMLGRLVGEDIRVECALAPDLSVTKMDPGQLEQVLLNLNINAKDAMPDGGVLTIETRDVELDVVPEARRRFMSKGPHVMLTVGDTGEGMDEVTAARVFEPFFTTKAPPKGTGLGLSTVYGIVKQSGGSIWVDSELGTGTTFTIYLPRVEEPLSVVRTDQTEAAPRGAETILVVEDEDALRDMVRRMLQSAGYTVLAVANGAEALLRLEQHVGAIDLMLSDVVMPGMSGRELAARVAELRPRMRVLYTSGYAGDTIGHRGVLEPGLHFLAKPYEVRQLAKKVRDVLDF